MTRQMVLELCIGYDGLLLESVRAKATSQLCLARYVTSELERKYLCGNVPDEVWRFVFAVGQAVRMPGERRYLDEVIAKG